MYRNYRHALPSGSLSIIALDPLGIPHLSFKYSFRQIRAPISILFLSR